VAEQDTPRASSNSPVVRSTGSASPQLVPFHSSPSSRFLPLTRIRRQLQARRGGARRLRASDVVTHGGAGPSLHATGAGEVPTVIVIGALPSAMRFSCSTIAGPVGNSPKEQVGSEELAVGGPMRSATGC